MDEHPPEAPRTTPPIYAEQVVVPITPPPPSNPMGTWAFVFSILGWICLPFIGSIIGLLLGIVAVRREPRGLAIAAIVLSLPGGCFGGLMFALLGLPLLALAGISQSNIAFNANATASGTRVGEAVEQFRVDNGRLPANLEEVYGAGNVPTDENGSPLRLRTKVIEFGSQFEIQAIGDDLQWDTADDRTLYSTTTVTTPDGAKMTETRSGTSGG